MRKLYEAANSIEAHMIADLLKQEGMDGQVEGDFLQGAAGGLPPGTPVRVTVHEYDYDAARKVLERWSATHPPEPPAPRILPAAKKRARWPWLLAGLLVGVACTLGYVRTPVTQQGADYNGDGRLDETWTYSASGRAIRMEADRNLDGKIDLIQHYDAKGVLERAESDDDFDGKFESLSRFRAGNIETSTADTDGDGFIDMQWNYKYGVIDTIQYLQPKTGVVRKTEFYKLGRLTHADVDTDGDGTMDQRTSYDALGAPVKTEPIKAP